VSAEPGDEAGEHAEWVDAPRALEALAERVATARRVAIDTEGNSLHAYRERTCVVQVTEGGRTSLVDPLALPTLRPLRDALDRDDVEVVLHGGDYDVSVLTRDHDFRFRRLFDTMVAATLLSLPRVGLADLVAAEFGVVLDKRFQKADWAMRPLTPEHVAYLRRDTAYLLGLRERLGERLRAADLEEEAQIEFARLARRRGTPAVFDPEAWREAEGADRLADRGRAALARLFAWRDEEARTRDVPPFRVLPPRALVLLAEAFDRGADPLRVLHPGDLRRHGAGVRAAIAAAGDDVARGAAPPPTDRPRLGPEERAERDRRRRREDALKAWRKAEASRRGVPNVVVLPNPAVEALVREEGGLDLAGLARIPDVGPRRVQRYGEEILRVLARIAR
jgi:ribonuclease D